MCLQSNAALQQLLAVESMGEPRVPSARHIYPDHSSFAPPVALPIEKDRVRLQVNQDSELCCAVLCCAGTCTRWQRLQYGALLPTVCYVTPSLVCTIGSNSALIAVVRNMVRLGEGHRRLFRLLTCIGAQLPVHHLSSPETSHTGVKVWWQSPVGACHERQLEFLLHRRAGRQCMWLMWG